jgi:triacylglycerol lipase
MAGPIQLDAGNGFSPDNVRFFARVCRAAYFPDDGPTQAAFRGGLRGLDRFEGPLDSHGFVARAEGFAVLAFRGTFPLSVENWLTDADAPLGPAPDAVPGRVHRGFADAFNGLLANGMDQRLASLEGGLDLWITGHSLGGALATLASVHLPGRPSFRGVYTFASPRVGDPDFAGGYSLAHFRVVNDNDIVPRVPPQELGYRHVGTRVFLAPGQEPQVSEAGDDPDESLSGGDAGGRVRDFLQAGLTSLPGGLDPLGPLAALPGPADVPGALLNQFLGGSFAAVERWADGVCQRFPSGLCDHFPLSYLRALGGDDETETT